MQIDLDRQLDIFIWSKSLELGYDDFYLDDASEATCALRTIHFHRSKIQQSSSFIIFFFFLIIIFIYYYRSCL